MILEAYAGAFAAGKRFRRQVCDIEDGAQDAALAVLVALSKGRVICHPKRYGSLVARTSRNRAGLRVGSKIVESFADGFGWSVQS